MSEFTREIDARINEAIARRDREALDDLLKELLRPAKAAPRAFAPALELTPKARQALERAQAEAPLTDAFGVELGLKDAAIALANRISRAQRRIDYELKVLFGFSGLRLVSEGDSWFQYPLRLTDIIDVLAADPDKAVLSLDAAGDEVADILAQSEYLDTIGRLKPDAFLLSAGGNDLLGNGRLARYLLPYVLGKPARELIDHAALDARVNEIVSSYGRIVTEVAHAFPGLMILGHGYDLPFPLPNGPWLGTPLAEKQIPLDVGRDIVRFILDKFNDALAELQAQVPSYRHVDLRSKVDRGAISWFDELHPLNPGYARAAAEFRSVLAAVRPQMTLTVSAAVVAMEARERGGADAAEIDTGETFFCEEQERRRRPGSFELAAAAGVSAKPPVDRRETTTHQESRSGTKIDRIVIHYTTSRNIEGTISWFKNAPRGRRASAHYIVGQDGTLVQMVDDGMAAWHAAPINSRSIGIEHVAAPGDKITAAQARTSARLIGWLMSQYGIPKSGVIPHVCVKSTSCCGDLFRDFGGGAGKSCEQQRKALHAWMDSMGIGTGPAAILSTPAVAVASADGTRVEHAAADEATADQTHADEPSAPAVPGEATFDLAHAMESDIAPMPQMDPRLQWLVARSEAGEELAATMSTAVDEVGVIARVSDTEAWINLSEARTPTVIGEAGGKGYIVTGRIPVGAIESVRTQPFVLSLKAAQDLQPMTNATVREIRALPQGALPPGALPAQQLPPNSQSGGGVGVIVGVIDYGVDFAHRNLRKADGTTRFVAFWHQDAEPRPGSPFDYGREYGPAEINEALLKEDPYAALGYDPALYDSGTGSHGTHVIDIAAGNGLGTQFPGVAPNADLIFVNISHAQDPRGTNVVGVNFGDSLRLLEAVKYIFEKAGDAPCVINISLGTNGGPHDGTTLVEQGLDSLLTEKPNRAIVMAAGNAFEDGIHAQGAVSTGGTTDLAWVVQRQPDRDIEMELWYSGQDRFTVELLDPSGIVRVAVPPGDSKTLQLGGRVVLVANRLRDPNNQDNMIGVFLARGIKAGTYTVRLRGDNVVDGKFHAWIERDNAGISRFAAPHESPLLTIGSISCGQNSLAVASYDGHKSSTPISSFSSAGRTRDNRDKPEVSAPGHNVRAARSSTGTGTTIKSGTSMAAPAVTGVIALMYAEAHARGLTLTVQEVREILIETARRQPPQGAGWDVRYGHGRVDAHAAVARVIAKATVAVLPAVAARSAKPRVIDARDTAPGRKSAGTRRNRSRRLGG